MRPGNLPGRVVERLDPDVIRIEREEPGAFPQGRPAELGDDHLNHEASAGFQVRAVCPPIPMGTMGRVQQTCQPTRPDIVAYHHPSASRQPATRRYQEARNRALVAWLRRPLRCALTETGRLTRQAVHDPIAGRALGGLAVRLPRALLGRRPLPADVETAIRALGADHAG